MTHECQFMISPKSTFGLTRVNAVLVYVGELGERPNKDKRCRRFENRIIAYAECSKKDLESGMPRYYWPPLRAAQKRRRAA